jgi:MFS family permease
MLLKDRNKIIGTTHIPFDIKLLKRVEFLLLSGYGWFSMLAYVVLIFSLANYANAIGLNASQASVVSATLNLGQALGRPPIGYFSDGMGRINMAALMTFLSGLFALAVWIPAKTYGVLIFYSIIGGSVAGTFWATIAPLSAEVAGIKHVPSALSVIWLVIVLPCTFSEPIALEIVDGTGRYIGTQLFTGFIYVAAALCLVFLRGWKIGELDALSQMSAGKRAGTEVEDAEARAAGRRRLLRDFWKWRRV